MADSFSGIMYGITVSVADLVAASTAYSAMKPALIGLGVIQARRKASKLQGHFLDKVPAEIWSSIEDELRQLSIVDARLEWMERVHCGECAAVELLRVMDELTDGSVGWDTNRLDRHIERKMKESRLAYHRVHVPRPDWIDWTDPFGDDDCDSEGMGNEANAWHEMGTTALQAKVGAPTVVAE